MLTMIFDTTSGMIVIRIALIQSVPTTSMADPNVSSPGRPDAAIAAPTAKPAASPMSAWLPTLVRRFRGSLIARSPPLDAAPSPARDLQPRYSAPPWPPAGSGNRRGRMPARSAGAGGVTG